MFTGIGNNPITEDLAYYNQLTKTGEAHKATCLCSRTTLNLRIPRITPKIAHAGPCYTAIGLLTIVCDPHVEKAVTSIHVSHANLADTAV